MSAAVRFDCVQNRARVEQHESPADRRDAHDALRGRARLVVVGGAEVENERAVGLSALGSAEERRRATSASMVSRGKWQVWIVQAFMAERCPRCTSSRPSCSARAAGRSAQSDR